MAERRMFAKTIIDSDAFLDMPVTARLLYYDLAMRADDDGFVNSPKKIMRMIGASQDDLTILGLRKFIIPFESGIVVIKHWRIHNYIRKDTYNETKYKDEKSELELDENNAYRRLSVDGSSTQVRLGKDRIDKDNIIEPPAAAPALPEPTKKKQFVKPTLDEVRAYCLERGKGVDADKWYNHYTANGWKVGRNSMKDWKAAVRTWEPKEGAETHGRNAGTGGSAGKTERIGNYL